MTVIVFGSANVDLVMPVSTFPTPGETVLTPSYPVSYTHLTLPTKA